MSYPSSWKGSKNKTSGVARFKIEGADYVLPMDCFTDYQTVCKMLEAAFEQGKQFAENVMRTKVIRALNEGVDK